jgi:inward rectifier potassium channel
MAEAEFRVILMRNEPTKEGEVFRRFYPLQLQFDRLILFPAIITIRHIIDEHSPLFGQTFAHLQDSDARIAASIVCIDTVVPAPVQSHLTYGWRDIIVNHKFVEVYTEISEKTMTVDYALFHTTEPVSAARPNPS